MNSKALKLVGIIIAVLDIIIALVLPGMYRNAMEKKCKDDITTTEATVVTVSSTSKYYRGGKGSRGTTHYIYNILASSDGEIMELVEHDNGQEKLQIEEKDTITVYCLNDKYAYDPEDYYEMSGFLRTLMIIPMFIGVGMVMIGSFKGKNGY